MSEQPNSGFPALYMGLPNDDGILAAVGTIAIRHGQLDYALKMAVKDLSGVSAAEALDATARQTSGPLRDRVRLLARKRFGDGAPLVRLDAILGRARRATERRNHLLHSLWAVELDGPLVMKSAAGQFEPAPSIADLNGVADNLAMIAKDLNFARLDGFLKDALAN